MKRGELEKYISKKIQIILFDKRNIEGDIKLWELLHMGKHFRTKEKKPVPFDNNYYWFKVIGENKVQLII